MKTRNSNVAVVHDVSEQDRIALERLIFFSDAVIAIAITLLAIDLRVIPTQNTTVDQLPRLLVGLAPQFLAFVISFFVIGSFWSAHQRLFLYIKRYDSVLIRANLIFLFLVVMMPFPTSVLANFGGTFAGVTLYAGIVSAIALVRAWTWRYATDNHRLVDPDLPDELIRSDLRASLLAAGIFLVSIPIALINPYLAEFSWIFWRFLLLLISLIDRQRARK